jgi:hypothetical protein
MQNTGLTSLSRNCLIHEFFSLRFFLLYHSLLSSEHFCKHLQFTVNTNFLQPEKFMKLGDEKFTSEILQCISVEIVHL